MDDEPVSIIDCADGEKPAEHYVWEINTKGGQKLFGILIDTRFLADGSIQSFIFDRGSFQGNQHLEIPWSAIDTIRHAKEFSPWLTNKRQS